MNNITEIRSEDIYWEVRNDHFHVSPSSDTGDFYWALEIFLCSNPSFIDMEDILYKMLLTSLEESYIVRNDNE